MQPSRRWKMLEICQVSRELRVCFCNYSTCQTDIVERDLLQCFQSHYFQLSFISKNCRETGESLHWFSLEIQTPLFACWWPYSAEFACILTISQSSLKHFYIFIIISYRQLFLVWSYCIFWVTFLQAYSLIKARWQKDSNTQSDNKKKNKRIFWNPTAMC